MKTKNFNTYVNKSNGKHYFLRREKNVVHRIYNHFENNDVFVYYSTTHATESDAVVVTNKIGCQRIEKGYKNLGVQRLEDFTLPYKWYVGPKGTDV